jgi:hypothetical protein
LRRAFVPTLVVAAAAGAGAFAGTRLGAEFATQAGRYADSLELGFAVMLGLVSYAVVTLALRSRLPLARLARAT